MIIDAYPWLAGALVVGLVLAFGGDYEHGSRHGLTHYCPEAVSSQSCFVPALGEWPMYP